MITEANKPRRASVYDILAEVCDYLDVESDRVLSSKRTTRLVAARRLFWLLCRDITTLSFPEIAEVGGWGHSSVVGGVNTAQFLCDTGGLIPTGPCDRSRFDEVYKAVTRLVRARMEIIREAA